MYRSTRSVMYRKTNKSKHVDPSCKNHGSCKVCEANRLYSSRRRMQETPEDAAARNDRAATDVVLVGP